MSDGAPDAEISALLGNYESFRREMLALIPRIVVDAGDQAYSRPLARFDTAAPGDPTVALVEAFATLADIVSFYQDRTLNEGFLPTAVDYSSLALLGRSVGEGPGAHVGASAALALFAQPGKPVTVPKGAVIQANPPKAGGDGSDTDAPGTNATGSLFETVQTVTADPALNMLTPLQTRPARLEPKTTSLLLQGIGLGLVVGDFLILSGSATDTATGKAIRPWVRLTVFMVTENSKLGTTLVEIGAPLQDQWTASGASAPLPLDAASGLRLFAVDLTCRLFGYNAPAWSAQSAAVQRANTPPDQSPTQYGEWPMFGIDLNRLDLQAVYSQVLPGSQFLLETPQDKRLGTIAAVSRQNLAEYGMTGQSTEVALAPGVTTQPSGNALVPARTGHSATVLDDGRVLIVGGVGQWGVLDSVELFDPATGLVSQITALPAPRARHSATMVGGVLYLAGGVLADFSLATDLLRFDDASLTFSTVAVAGSPPAPRIAHAALALPDSTLLINGGLTESSGSGHASLAALEATLAATPSVAVFSPQTNSWLWQADLKRARADHSATLCPVVAPGGNADSPSIGQVVVFLGGHDGGAMPPALPGAPPSAPTGSIWADAELSDPVDWKPAGTIYAIESTDGTKGTARYDHVATPLIGNNGFLVTGGQSAAGAVADNWLVGVIAQDAADADKPDFSGVPVFVPAPKLTVARSNHAAALLSGGKVVIAGGFADGTVLKSTETYGVNPAASIPFGGAVLSEAVPGRDLPGRQADAAYAALASDTLLMTGGLGTLPDGYLDAVVAYDPNIGTTISFPGPALSTPYSYVPAGTLALRDGTVLMLGVSNPGAFPLPPDGAMGSFAWTFDPATKLATITGAPLTPRLGATLTPLANGSVLLAGGMGIDKDGRYAVLDTAEIYDPRNRVFRVLASRLEVGRLGHSATALADGTVLIAGGFYFPPLTYDPAGVWAVLVPALSSAELFNNGTQAFAPIASSLSKGFALHAATRLDNGDVLITGGVSRCYAEYPFDTIEVAPLTQAAVYTAASQGFAMIAPLPGPRAQHSATLLAGGKVAIAGGLSDAAMTATATTLLFDPRTATFAADTPLARPRRAHGAIEVPDGVLMIGGIGEDTTEIFVPGAKQAAPTHALPLPLPSPLWPVLPALAQQVAPVAFDGFGVFAFGGTIDPTGGGSGSTVIQYVEAPLPPGYDARRQALVYTQTSELTLAPPIDNWPVGLVEPDTGPSPTDTAHVVPPAGTPGGALDSGVLVLGGLIDGIAVGQALVVAGNPPLAQAVGTIGPPDIAANVASGPVTVKPGDVVMVHAELPSANGQAWQCEVADIGLLTLVTDPTAKPPTALKFLSGNGGTIGAITAAELKLYDRPVHSETVTVRSVVQHAASATTTVTLAAPLRYLYDRTTTTVYGNVVTVTQGGSVLGEILGSGDGKTTFQTFLLKQAPLTWIEDSDGSIRPQLRVTVGGNAWDRVPALYDCGPDDPAYQLLQDAQGRAQIRFGDGVHGLRLPTGQNNVVASYRVGAGTDGNVAAGSLTRAPAHVAGIKGVLNPVAASGGIGAPPRGLLRARIPNGVRDLGRIVTQDDMLSFLRNRPEIGSATLSTEVDARDVPTSLLTLAGPGNTVPDPRAPAFVSLGAGFAAALAAPLAYLLLPYTSVPFKLDATFRLKPDQDEQAVRNAMIDAVRSTYAASTMAFGRPVRLNDVKMLLAAVPGVAMVEITKLWLPTRQRAGPHPVLEARPARLAFPAPESTGAEILSISPDSDAVYLTLALLAPPLRGPGA